MSWREIEQIIDTRLEDEWGTVYKRGGAPLRVALVYPSPYRVGMSSLGYQVMYRELNARADVVAERAFLPDDLEAWRATRKPLITYESRRPVSDFDIIAFSLAYEIELTGLFACLELSGVPIRREERGPHHPIVLIGGPLTFSNPLPAALAADLMIFGEAEDAIHELVDAALDGMARDELEALAPLSGFYVPTLHGDALITVAKATDEKVPAHGAILTPHTELANMHLVEAERGCSRKCTFCVMRRSTNGGMRLAAVDAVLDPIPDAAKKVGLVGAAVSDHPHLVPIVEAIVESGRGVGLSSLRADRLTPELMDLLKRGGYRTITVASDGASERLRVMLAKRIREKHLRRAAELVRDHGLKQLKVYMMIGVPGEEDKDLEELVAFTNDLSRICNVALGIAPFVAKRNTPLDRQPFAGMKVVDKRLKYLRRNLDRRVDLRSTSSRWAYIEYCMAQSGIDGGEIALSAYRAGGSFAAWKRAIKEAGGPPVGDAPPPVFPRNRAERLALGL